MNILRCVAVLCAAGGLLPGAAPARLTYSRAFPGSTPDYLQIVVDSDGALEYGEAPADPHPLQAHLSQTDTAALFDMAARLNYFKSPIESGLKVANTGKKIFRYQAAAGAASEVTFNYSTDPVAQKLLERFEEIAASERAYLDLDRTVHFDKLGVNDSLAEIEALWLKKQLAAPEQFIPLLTRVANHESFMHLARDRAARLKDEFSKPALPAVADGAPAASASDAPENKTTPNSEPHL